MSTIKYTIDQTIISKVCATIKTDTTEIMTRINSRYGCSVSFLAIAQAIRTIVVIMSAWVAMLQTLTPPPTMNCRNMFCLCNQPLTVLKSALGPTYCDNSVDIWRVNILFSLVLAEQVL